MDFQTLHGAATDLRKACDKLEAGELRASASDRLKLAESRRIIEVLATDLMTEAGRSFMAHRR